MISYFLFCVSKNVLKYIEMQTNATKKSKYVAKYTQLLKSIPIIPIFSNEIAKTPAKAEKIVKIMRFLFFFLVYILLIDID